MVDTDKPDDQNLEMQGTAMMYVPGRGLVLVDQDRIVEGMERLGLEESHVLPCFIVRGADRGRQWVHLYSAVVGDAVVEALRSEGTVGVPLTFSIQGGGALLITHKDKGFVRAYGPGTWDRIFRFEEEFIELEGEDSPSIE